MVNHLTFIIFAARAEEGMLLALRIEANQPGLFFVDAGGETLLTLLVGGLFRLLLRSLRHVNQ